MTKRYKFDNQALVHLTPTTAWILGVLFTDGCITRSNTNYWKMELGSKDIDLLKNINKAMSATHPILLTSGILKNYYRITYCGTEFAETPFDWGMTPRKTFTLEWPKGISDDLVSHFIRGLYDGDGSFYISKSHGRLGSKFISASPVFIHEMAKHIQAKTNIQKSITSDGPNLLRYQLNHHATVALSSWLYADSVPGNRLERKYNVIKPYLTT